MELYLCRGTAQVRYFAPFYSYFILTILIMIWVLIHASLLMTPACLFIVENPDTAARLINDDLNKISTWAGKWLVNNVKYSS